MDSHLIEISFRIKTEASLAVWVDRTEWDAMSQEQQRAKLIEAQDAADAATQEPIDLSYNAKMNLCVAILEGEPTDIQVYDPEL